MFEQASTFKAKDFILKNETIKLVQFVIIKQETVSSVTYQTLGIFLRLQCI